MKKKRINEVKKYFRKKFLFFYFFFFFLKESSIKNKRVFGIYMDRKFCKRELRRIAYNIIDLQ
jgi:hypothetical protein